MISVSTFYRFISRYISIKLDIKRQKILKLELRCQVRVLSSLTRIALQVNMLYRVLAGDGPRFILGHARFFAPRDFTIMDVP